MDIQEITTKKEYEEKSRIAKYSPEDIKQLIKEDLRSKGYKTDEVCFQTEYKYIDDEWGMNRSLVTIFNGATIKIICT